MSTHSGISVKVSNSKVLHVYNHCDGDLRGAGMTLNDYYNSLKRATALVENGNISLLRGNILPDTNKPHGWYDFEHTFSQKDVCRFYGRDRDEDENEVEILESVDEAPNYEFNYYFDGTEWLVRTEKQKKWTKLTTALVKW